MNFQCNLCRETYKRYKEWLMHLCSTRHQKKCEKNWDWTEDRNKKSIVIFDSYVGLTDLMVLDYFSRRALVSDFFKGRKFFAVELDCVRMCRKVLEEEVCMINDRKYYVEAKTNRLPKFAENHARITPELSPSLTSSQISKSLEQDADFLYKELYSVLKEYKEKDVNVSKELADFVLSNYACDKKEKSSHVELLERVKKILEGTVLPECVTLIDGGPTSIGSKFDVFHLQINLLLEKGNKSKRDRNSWKEECPLEKTESIVCFVLRNNGFIPDEKNKNVFYEKYSNLKFRIELKADDVSDYKACELYSHYFDGTGSFKIVDTINLLLFWNRNQLPQRGLVALALFYFGANTLSLLPKPYVMQHEQKDKNDSADGLSREKTGSADTSSENIAFMIPTLSPNRIGSTHYTTLALLHDFFFRMCQAFHLKVFSNYLLSLYFMELIPRSKEKLDSHVRKMISKASLDHKIQQIENLNLSPDLPIILQHPVSLDKNMCEDVSFKMFEEFFRRAEIAEEILSKVLQNRAPLHQFFDLQQYRNANPEVIESQND